MSDLPGYARAQREYDNRTPPDDGPSECPDCTSGYRHIPFLGDLLEVKCETCAGFGLIDENGEPFDPHAAEIAADIAADHRRQDYRHD